MSYAPHDYPAHPSPGWQVYFIKPVGLLGPIKIGCSSHPMARLGNIMEWSPLALEVILTIPGGLDLEQRLHNCFADAHSHREWFHATDRLRAAIAAMQAGTPVDEAVDLNDVKGSVRSLKLKQAQSRKGTSQETYSL